MSNPVLSVHGVQKSFGRKPVLRGGGLQANTGELVCLVGENGSGKSTLLKIIAGVLKPDSGFVARTGKLGYCPQDSLLYQYLTIDEHFQLFGAAYGLSDKVVKQRSEELMEIFTFNKFRYTKVQQLSGGTQQKLNLSLALLHDPELLLLDEPYAGFDWETYQHFLSYTIKAKKQGKCIMMVSHLVYEKQRFDAVFQLHEGVIHAEIA
ncbi:MAG: ATP-binding cassette domain-containing protein [bacterium]